VVSGEHVWSGTDLRVDRARGMRQGFDCTDGKIRVRSGELAS
jgi:hypothetical protein